MSAVPSQKIKVPKILSEEWTVAELTWNAGVIAVFCLHFYLVTSEKESVTVTTELALLLSIYSAFFFVYFSILSLRKSINSLDHAVFALLLWSIVFFGFLYFVYGPFMTLTDFESFIALFLLLYWIISKHRAIFYGKYYMCLSKLKPVRYLIPMTSVGLLLFYALIAYVTPSSSFLFIFPICGLIIGDQIFSRYLTGNIEYKLSLPESKKHLYERTHRQPTEPLILVLGLIYLLSIFALIFFDTYF